MSGLVAISPLLAAFFELITEYEAQSTHAKTLSKFTVALNISRLDLFNPVFIISWHFSPSSPGALDEGPAKSGTNAYVAYLRSKFCRLICFSLNMCSRALLGVVSKMPAA